MPVSFTAKLAASGPTEIVVPPKAMTALGAATKRPPVTVTINGGFTYRSTIMPMGGRLMIPLSAERREAAGVKHGQQIDVTLALDTAERTVDVPPDFALALAAEPKAKAAFEKLAYTHRKEHVRAIEDAKKPETRANRIAAAIVKLSAGK